MSPGAVVDRTSRKWLMVGANSLQGLIVLAIPGAQHLAVVVTAYLLMSVVNQFFVPARAATIPDLVPGPALMGANALFGMAFVGAIAIGPALGGWVADTWGLDAAFYVDSATFLVPAIAVAALRLPARTPPPPDTPRRRSIVGDTREGMRFAAHDQPTRIALTASTGAYLVIAVMSVLGVVVAQDTLGLSVSGYGLMMSSMGAGMLVAALALGRRRTGSRPAERPTDHTTHHTRLGLVGLLLAGVGLGILPWLQALIPALACSAVIGAGVLAVQISSQTTLQSAPAHLRGRVLSLGQSVTGIAQVLAIALTAALTAPLGASWVLCGTGILTAATAFALLAPRTESHLA
ncbi:MAG: MFS transporter [Dermatophilaceae bacterium]